MTYKLHVKTAAITSLLACIVIGVQWKRNHYLKKKIVHIEHHLSKTGFSTPSRKNISSYQRKSKQAFPLKPNLSFENKLKHVEKLHLAYHEMPENIFLSSQAYLDILETAHSMSTEEMGLALQEIKDHELKEILAMVWAEKDGFSAVVFALNHNATLQSICLEQWALNDPNAAYSWYESNSHKLKVKPHYQARFAATVIAKIAESNFNLAFSKAKDMDKVHHGEVLKSLGKIATANPEHLKEFTSYLHTLDDSRSRTQAAIAIANQLANKTIDMAVGFVEGWPDNKDKTNIAHGLARTWGKTEPSEAILWALKFPGTSTDTNTIPEVVDDIFKQWCRRAPEEAKAWNKSQDKINKEKLDLLIRIHAK